MSEETAVPKKKPLQIIQVPLDKINDEILPYHKTSFENHKNRVLKLIALGSIREAQNEIQAKQNMYQQLNDVIYELDSLRTEIQDEQLGQLDAKLLPIRKAFLNLLDDYIRLKNTVLKLSKNQLDPDLETSQIISTENEPSAIRIVANVEELNLQKMEKRLVKVEQIQQDLEGLRDIQVQLHGMALEQGENVNRAEESINNAAENVDEGVKHLKYARQLKVASYPVMGAAIGGALGGPIGLVVGAKAGGIAAICCGLVGFFGGTVLKSSTNSGKLRNFFRKTTISSDPDENDKKDA